MALRPMAPPPETADFRNERRRIFLDMVSTRFVMGHGGEQIAAGNVPDCGVTKHAQAGLHTFLAGRSVLVRKAGLHASIVLSPGPSMGKPC